MATDIAEFIAPTDLSHALDILAQGRHTILAGGTDFYPARVGRPLTEPVIDITGIDGLRGINRVEGFHRIGTLTTWSDLITTELPPGFDGLKMAAGQIGGIQIQNVGTIGGNLCNASPAADGIPPLLALDASVELASPAGTRVVALEEFLTGYRSTSRQPGELLTAVLVPEEFDDATSSFWKLGSRAYLVISVAMVAATIVCDADGTIETARVAIGACSPVAKRLHALEADLAGRHGDAADAVTVEHLADLSPIDDIRAGVDERRNAALHLVRRTVASCLS